MDKKELKHQAKDLYNVLIEYIEHSPSLAESIINITKIHSHIRHKIDSGIYLREIKRRKLTNDFIRKHKPFDIHEALNIDIKEARKKLKNFDFTIKEKNIILDTFCGGAESFLKEYNGEVIN